MISGEDKVKINKFRFGMKMMLLPMNRTQAKLDFLSFSEKASQEIKMWKSWRDEGFTVKNTADMQK